MFVTAGKVLVAKMLIDEAGFDTGLTYCALGTDDTPPALANEALGAEAVRKAVTTKTRASNEITLTTFFLASEAALAIEEQGVFGHSTAGPGADSGVLFNRNAVAYDNSGGGFDIIVDVVVTIG